jgi:hypothetical protein
VMNALEYAAYSKMARCSNFMLHKNWKKRQIHSLFFVLTAFIMMTTSCGSGEEDVLLKNIEQRSL